MQPTARTREAAAASCRRRLGKGSPSVSSQRAMTHMSRAADGKLSDMRSMNGLARATDVLRIDVDVPAPVYIQLERRLRVAVTDGMLQPGDQLPSVRGLASRLRVSPNTVGRAYANLAREGVLVAHAGGDSQVAPRDRLDRPALDRSRQERL